MPKTGPEFPFPIEMRPAVPTVPHKDKHMVAVQFRNIHTFARTPKETRYRVPIEFDSEVQPYIVCNAIYGNSFPLDFPLMEHLK